MTAQLDAGLNRQLQDSSGLSMADYDVLVPLSEAPDGRLRMFEIAQALHWTTISADGQARPHRPSTASPRGRGAFVVLTDAGRTTIEQAAPGHADTVRQLVFDGLSAPQVKTLRAVTGEVLERLAATEA